MSSVQRRPNGQWRARLRVDGREVSRHFARKVDAERWLNVEGARVQSGDWIDPRSGAVTVAEYAPMWVAAQTWRTSTRDSIEGHLRNHVVPHLGRRPLGRLQSHELRAWITGLSDGLATTTVENIGRSFSMMLRAAVRERIIRANPMDGVRIPTPPRELVVPFTVPELSALVAEAPERWRALILVGSGCGLRVGEATGLADDAVDWLRRRVRVVRQLVIPTHGRRYALGPPKTRTSTREVPLPEHVGLALSEHVRRFPGVELDGLPLIFSGERGAVVHRSAVADMLTRASKAARLTRRVKFHDLRHHYASLLIASGLSVKAVQTALGHATAAETLDTYGHLWPGEGDALGGAIERAWAAVPPSGGQVIALERTS